MQLVQRLALKYVRTKFKILSSISKRKAAEKAFELFCTPQYRNKKDLPELFKKAEQLEFQLDGNTVRGYRWNHPSPRKALILHGFESSVVNFEKYVAALVKLGYEVAAFDAPAHGRSSGKSVTVLVYKNMLHHVYNTYGPFNAFIAHSFGGLILSLGLEEIQHDASVKVVLIAPAAETKTAIDNFFNFMQLNPDLRPEFENIIAELGGKPANWYSISRAAANIKADVLFVQDKDDYMTPLTDVKPIILKNYPNFKFVITEGLGHRRIYRDNETVKKVIDFLS